jgi:hypothetical protein
MMQAADGADCNTLRRTVYVPPRAIDPVVMKSSPAGSARDHCSGVRPASQEAANRESATATVPNSSVSLTMLMPALAAVFPRRRRSGFQSLSRLNVASPKIAPAPAGSEKIQSQLQFSTTWLILH